MTIRDITLWSSVVGGAQHSAIAHGFAAGT